MTAKHKKTIENLTEELLNKLDIPAEVTVTDQDEVVLVSIEATDSAVLIGHHGRNLEAIQILLGQMVFKKTGEWTRIIVTVGDYRERRQQQLESLALSIAQRVIETKTSVTVSDLSPGERRIVHLALTDHPEVVSESAGEGRERKLTVKLRS